MGRQRDTLTRRPAVTMRSDETCFIDGVAGGRTTNTIITRTHTRVYLCVCVSVCRSVNTRYAAPPESALYETIVIHRERKWAENYNI